MFSFATPVMFHPFAPLAIRFLMTDDLHSTPHNTEQKQSLVNRSRSECWSRAAWHICPSRLTAFPPTVTPELKAAASQSMITPTIIPFSLQSYISI
ncbi:hypothetical protein Pcinc_041488 [Petrolisthes cinctipes]|uniref:Uncharacterized protein n=1 Tax=Petrolisthes cinctipes TaxID=88211 RepID=A0AAE1EID4_PETCI|nr:hypothetical protein Pcinc_041488 [Petrolisthes cinctipes]